MSLLADSKMYGRFLFGLRHFLRQPITSLEAARMIIKKRMEQRESNFLRLLERGIFDYPRSPYLPLLKIAGCEMGDIQNMVKNKGLEDTLRALREEGVYVSFQEFKGREPIRRHGQVIPVRANDFDNPYLKHHYQTESGGSTGAGTRVPQDFDYLAAQAYHTMLAREAHGVLDAPLALWRGTLPDGSGINNVLKASYYGRPPQKWFTFAARDWKPAFKYRLATKYTVGMGRLFGVPIPRPEAVSLDRAIVVARWAVEAVNTHDACLICAPVSRALRICMAAQEEGLDLSGATFEIAGEPLTPTKMHWIARSGANYYATYGLAEAGRTGMGCVHPADYCDVHLLKDGFALISYPYQIPNSDITVSSFNLTTLLPSATKIMLNVEIDDYGTIENRSCGCPWESFGFTEHLLNIHSFGKLTGEGITLVGSEMINILEAVLPNRFGGSPLDYQLCEKEDELGFTKLILRVSPEIEILDEEQVVQVILDALGKSSTADDLARAILSQAKSFHIKREEPIWTNRGKLLSLHLAGSPKL